MSEGLTVRMEGEELVIRLPLDTIPLVVAACPSLWQEEGCPRVTDARVFADAVLMALHREEEDGTTHVHRMFDAAFVEAVERGAEGVVMPSDPAPEHPE